MEFMTPLIFIGIFVIASLSLFLVYKYGMKKKSFEEALAEHRQQASAILGPKPKPKENKKSKKIAKKEKKEKPTSNSSDIIDKIENVEPVNSESDEPHVEFKEEPEVVEINPDKDVKEISNKKRPKKQEKQARPILVKKSAGVQENVQVVDVKDSAPPLNHFELIQPKDDVELKRSLSKEELAKSEALIEDKKVEKIEKPKKTKHQKQEQQIQKSVPVADPQPLEKVQPIVEKEEKVIEKLIAPQIQEPTVNSGKEKKKKKSELNTKQQSFKAERDEILNSVRKAELSRTEVQMLIELLLNKQLEAPEVIDEWSEGKSDPVQKLKKQLAEKEKLLEEEQQALVGVQTKLKEVRGEQFTERAQWQQKVRGLEESKVELVSTNTRLQQKLQEIQEQHNKDMMNFKQLIDENNAIKVRLMSFQETEGIMIQMRAENEHLGSELQRLTREIQEQQNAYVMQISNLQQELMDRKVNYDGFSRKQIEETQILTSELHTLTQKIARGQKEREDFLKIISELKLENERLKKEHEVQRNGSSEEHQAHEVKVKNLSNELSSVRNELTSVIRKFQDAEKKYQSDLESTTIKVNTLHGELEEQKNKNNDLRKKNWKVMEALNAAESRTKPADKSREIDVNEISKEILSKEQQAQKEFLQRLFPEIEDLNSTFSVDNWQEQCGNLIEQYVEGLRKKAEKPLVVSPPQVNNSELAELQAQIKHYKQVIDDTDRILNNLQQKTEREEMTWREKLLERETEIEELRNSTLKQLQAKVSSLESQLSQERLESERLAGERLQLANRPEPKGIHADATATIERLSEEVDHLKELLRIEQLKNVEVNGCPKAQNLYANSINGPALTNEGSNS